LASAQSAPSKPTLIPARIVTNPWIVLLVLTLGFFMILLDTTIVNVAIPAMEKGLNASFDSILWVLNGYVLVYATLLITGRPVGGQLWAQADVHHRPGYLHRLLCRLRLL